jgi:hypothetical protein
LAFGTEEACPIRQKKSKHASLSQLDVEVLSCQRLLYFYFSKLPSKQRESRSDGILSRWGLSSEPRSCIAGCL